MRTSILRSTGLVVVAVLCLDSFGEAQADSPSDQYEVFSPSIPTILDNHTLLRWQRFITTDPMTYEEAEKFCETFLEDAALTGFRIPTVKELLTIVDEQPHEEYEGAGLVTKSIDRQAFPKTPAEGFWSSSVSWDSGRAFVVDFSDGRTTREKKSDKDKYRVRCVRFEDPDAS